MSIKRIDKSVDLKNIGQTVSGLTSELADLVTVNVKNFGAKGDGVTNDTAAIQSAINAVSSAVNSTYNTTYFGVVFLPKGVYNVTNLTLKSNVHIRGSGIAITRINPIGTSGYVFDVTGTDRVSKLAQCEIKDLTISPKDRFSSADYGTRPNVGGINFNFVERVSLRNLKINGIAGIGVNNVENFDAYFENLEFVYVGTDSNTPAMVLGGTTQDGSNAIHVVASRFEACASMLKLKDGARQNQFVGCKFEWSIYNSVPVRSVAGLIIEQSNQNAFVGCGFVGGDNVLPLIKVATTTNDVRGLKFTGSDFVAGDYGNSYCFEADTTALGINVTGCSFAGFRRIANSTGHIQFNSNEVIDCNTPCIVTSQGSVSNNIFRFMKGTDYIVKLNGSARCIGNTMSATDSTTCKGIYAENDAFIMGNSIFSLAEGINLNGTANIARSNRNSATTPYVNAQVDYNLLEVTYGTAISPTADTRKYQSKMATNFLGIQVHDGTTFQTAPILKTGTTRPVSGKIVGTIFFDTSLNAGAGMLILWNGTNWINPSTGATV